MIILEGPNTALRETLRHEIERQLRPELGDQLRVNVSGTPGLGTTAAVVRLLNTPNQTELRDGLPLPFPDHHPIHHMAGYALSATGTISVLALNGREDYLKLFRAPILEQLPYAATWGDVDIVRFTDTILKVWRERQREVATSYPFGGTGFMDEGGVMVVGERVNPFRPFNAVENFMSEVPLAFTSNQGCSFFLHGALAAAGGRYYLTNALKTLSKKLNRTLLAKELEIMRPRKIIAMGTEAAAALAEQRVDFMQTYHPQYWKRFKNKDAGELVELLRSASITTQNPV